MSEIFAALVVAARCLLTRRMLRLVIWPLIGACVVWAVIAGVFWGDWVALMRHLVESHFLEQIMSASVLAFIGSALAWLLVFPLFILAVLATALIVTSILGMPAVVNDIAQRYYPQLERLEGGTIAGSIGNAVVATLFFVVLMILSLPLWFLVPFGGVILPLIIGGWLNARLFRYDSLAEHASPREYRDLLRRSRAGLFGLGLALAGMQVVLSYTLILIPFVLLFLPVYSALAFVYYSLGRLQQLRALESDNSMMNVLPEE